MQTPFRCVYAVVDGSIIQADVYVPSPAPSAKTALPVAIGIHGGAFMLGHSGMVSLDQIDDCLSRGWIVVSIDHRLCPQVSIVDGPITDARTALAWVHSTSSTSSLEAELAAHGHDTVAVDRDAVVAFGTSSGGTLALALGWGVPENAGVKAILDLYGATAFADPFWTQPLPHISLPPHEESEKRINRVYDEVPVPTQGGVSLEGQSQEQGVVAVDEEQRQRDLIRREFTFTNIGRGTLLDVAFPSKLWEQIDASLNVSPSFPPTCIVHGTEDEMVPDYLSKKLYAELQRHGVRSEFIEVPGERHTFVGKMVKGSRTWELQRKGFDFLEEVINRR
ncbi:Alpha/Beta hydrolase protein [Phyllosticta citribraziliensis]|uniref:Alpha/Beta hydrolase protein n=1 Tax=Phyllosticta citribraziliensis TaxID=989973 RepID=A0ABR1M3J8_9PEZI